MKDEMSKKAAPHPAAKDLLKDVVDVNEDLAKMSSEQLKVLIKLKEDQEMRKEILKDFEIKQLPDGRYRADVYINGIRHNIRKKSKKAVEDEIIRLKKEVPQTLVTIYPEYLPIRKAQVSANTWSKEKYYFDTYVKESSFGNIPLDKIKRNDLYEFLNHCMVIKPNMTKKYWDNIRIFINSMIFYAIENNMMQSYPFDHFKTKKDTFTSAPKKRDEDTVFSSIEQYEVTKLAEEDARATQTSEPLGIIILFNLGIRVGELCALKWGDIETTIKGPYIHIQREMISRKDEKGKCNGSEIVPHCKSEAGDRRLELNNKAIETFALIKKMNQENGINTDNDSLIFQRSYKKELYACTSRSFDPRLRRYCKEAGMTVIKSCHDIRRTVITKLYANGMPVKRIQRYAGHASLKQTLDYIRYTDDDDINQRQYLDTLSDTSMDENVVQFKRA